MNKTEGFISGILLIIFGIMCIAFRSGIISFAAWLVGAVLIIFGIMNMVTGMVMPGIVLLVLGIFVLLCGMLMVSLLLYILAICLIIAGAMGLYQYSKQKAVNESMISSNSIGSVLLLIGGIVMLFNQHGAVSIVFIIVGIALIASGVMRIASSR